MQEIINYLLQKPLAFIISLSGIIFLGFSGLTKFFQVEIEKTNSKRLFIAGMTLIIIGIPIYYLIDNKKPNNLHVELLEVDFYQNDEGHSCNPSMLHIRETFKIDNVNGEKIFKVILNTEQPIAQEIIYKDEQGRYVLNSCFKPNFKQQLKVIIITNSGKSSKILNYTINSENRTPKINAPRLNKF